MVNMSVFVTINPCASVSVGGLLRGGVSLGGSRLIRGPSCGSALTNSKAFVERPKRSRPVHSLLVKKLPILVDLDEEVSVGVCNIEQGVSFLCIRLDCADSPEWFVDDACSAIGVHCTSL